MKIYHTFFRYPLLVSLAVTTFPDKAACILEVISRHETGDIECDTYIISGLADEYLGIIQLCTLIFSVGSVSEDPAVRGIGASAYIVGIAEYYIVAGDRKLSFFHKIISDIVYQLPVAENIRAVLVNADRTSAVEL